MTTGPAGAPRSVRWERALVTGASSGIGLAMARLLARRGTDLVIVARDGERLRSLAAELRPLVEVEVLVADLADRDRLAAVVERVESSESPIDLLVNNAGFGFSGDFVDLDRDAETSVVEVNILALHRLAHAAATVMAERGRGGILNVSSIAGSGPAPRAATYAASKAFVTSFTKALHSELAPRGVSVSGLCPGLTRSEFHQRSGSRTDRTPGFLWQSAEEVAEAGLAGIDANRAVVVPGLHNKALSTGIRLAPLGLIDRIRRTFSGPRPA